MKLFDWIPREKKHAMIEWFNMYQQYVGTGKGLFSTVTEPAKLYFAVVGLATAVIAPEFVLDNKFVLGGAMIIFFIILPFYLGRWWDKSRGYHVQAEWSNKRNDMKAQLDRIEKDLLELKGQVLIGTNGSQTERAQSPTMVERHDTEETNYARRNSDNPIPKYHEK